jgi:hypothetical protein
VRKSEVTKHGILHQFLQDLTHLSSLLVLFEPLQLLRLLAQSYKRHADRHQEQP